VVIRCKALLIYLKAMEDKTLNLIEECGDDFHALYRRNDKQVALEKKQGRTGLRWTAQPDFNKHNDSYWFAEADNPIEALQILRDKLQKK